MSHLIHPWLISDVRFWSFITVCDVVMLFIDFPQIIIVRKLFSTPILLFKAKWVNHIAVLYLRNMTWSYCTKLRYCSILFYSVDSMENQFPVISWIFILFSFPFLHFQASNNTGGVFLTFYNCNLLLGLFY